MFDSFLSSHFYSCKDVFNKDNFLAGAHFKKRLIPSQDLDLGLTHSIIHVCPSYHSLSAYGSGEDVLQLKDDCQSLIIGHFDLQAAAKAQHLRT